MGSITRRQVVILIILVAILLPAIITYLVVRPVPIQPVSTQTIEATSTSGVLLGVYVGSDNPSRFTALETAIGRPHFSSTGATSAQSI